MIRKADEARRRACLAAMVGVLLAARPAAAAEDKPPLQNGGFEQPGRRKGLPAGWMTAFPQKAPRRPSFPGP